MRMKKGWSRATILAFAGTLMALPTGALAGAGLTRLSAQYTAVDGNVIGIPSTATPAGGPEQIYSNTLKVPNGNNVMYVTIQASGFTDIGGDIALNCQVDGTNCLNGTGTAGSGSVSSIPTGWVIPLGNEFGNGISLGATGLGYQWCIPLSKTKQGMHSVVINAGNAFGFANAWMEGVSVFVDVNNVQTSKSGTSNACGVYATPFSTTSPD
jgi:hypothetical protein